MSVVAVVVNFLATFQRGGYTINKLRVLTVGYMFDVSLDFFLQSNKTDLTQIRAQICGW